MNIDVAVRKAVPSDIARIVRQWLFDYRKSRWAGVVPNNLYKQVYADCIRQLLARGADLYVACNTASPEIILGFVCAEHTPRDQILHYLYLRNMYRGFGIGRLLLDAAGLPKGTSWLYTFRTDDTNFKALAQGHRHRPELARRAYSYKADLGEPVDGVPKDLC